MTCPEPHCACRGDVHDLKLVWNEHNNDIGDWCPYSGEALTGGEDDDRCPQGCRASAVENAD